jgi:DNA-binding transcriptional MerR regulator
VRIGEAAKRAGVNVETLRYYERRGLLPEPDRSLGGQREYDENTVRFVSAVKQAQSLGLSLREIEEVVRLARRDPNGAPDAIRRRLEDKLADVDGQIAELRRTRAGLGRALDEVWASVPRSTSTAAYLVRAGRHPELAPGEALHITNGESVASTLGETSLGGVVVAWQDVLHEGPLADVAAGELRPLRAGFLAAQGWGDASAIGEEMRRRDELLARALADTHPIVLWFEHDLFDQLQLLQVLAAIPDGSRAVELAQGDDHLGALTAPELEELWEERQPVTPEMAALGRAGWMAVCSDEIEPFLRRDTTSLPYLAPALERLLEERATLPRTDRQLLQALADGPATPLQLFVANQAAEGAVFLGDTWCFLRLYDLAGRGLVEPVGAGRMPLPPPRGDREAFTAVQLRLTAAGRELV